MSRRFVAAITAICILIEPASAQGHPDCTVKKALEMAKTMSPEEIGQGWKKSRQFPWHLGNASAALSACGFTKGPRWDELERRAAAFQHPILSNAELMRQGRDALLKDNMGVGPACQCALAVQAFGPRGNDLNGILKPER